MSQSMEDKKWFRFYRLMLDTALELDDDKMRADYFIALAKYGLDWEIPANPVMRALLKWAMYSIDKNTDKNQKISSSMEWNSNAIKNWENIQKQLITVEDSWTQFLSWSIEDNKKKKIKKEKKSQK